MGDSGLMKIWNWQNLFAKQPPIYWTECGGEPTGNFYDSHESAMLEVTAYSKRGNRTTIQSAHLHNLSLSHERWAQPKAAK